MADLPGTIVDLSETMVDLSGTMVDFLGTMEDFFGTMVSLANPCPKGRNSSAETCPKLCFKESLSVSEISIL